MRNETKEIRIGHLSIGGNQPIAVQSMTNTTTEDIKASLQQIRELETLGCDIIRLSANTLDAAKAFHELTQVAKVPLVADIHYDYRMALLSIENGAHKIRINPGNMPVHALDEIISCAKEYSIPIRLGVNSGSLSRKIVDSMGVTPESMLLSLKESVHYFESRNFTDLVLSAKSSDVKMTIAVNRLIKESFHYPIHLGVTEAGTRQKAIVKSAIGIGSLLADGIGDTIRVSMTGSPLQEISVAHDILQSLHLKKGLNIISCPTCARTKIDLLSIVDEVEHRLKDYQGHKTVAIMGCAVNGPGEAREADIGIAGGEGDALLFKKGKIIGKYPEDEIIDRLVEELIREE